MFTTIVAVRAVDKIPHRNWSSFHGGSFLDIFCQYISPYKTNICLQKRFTFFSILMDVSFKVGDKDRWSTTESSFRGQEENDVKIFDRKFHNHQDKIDFFLKSFQVSLLCAFYSGSISLKSKRRVQWKRKHLEDKFIFEWCFFWF